MSCWKCICGRQNCSTDECINPKCITHRGYTVADASQLLNDAGLNAEAILKDIAIIHTNPRLYSKDQITTYIAIRRQL